ncbi:hypothetical protein Tco_1380565 [Tanacetum coccineum]
MDDPNMTMEDYIKLEEEKARRRGRVFNWETATYGKIRVDDDLHDLRFVEAEFPAIVIDDAFAPQDTLPCKSQVKNDNEKADITSFPPPKPTTSYVDDLDIFKDFDNEFPAIVYNDDQTFKSDYLTRQTLSPQHNNESDLKDETSVSEYDKEEQNILYFNDLFPFNIIRPNDLKSENDNDDNDIDIIYGTLTTMLERIYSREIHKVQVVDFLRMPELMRDGLFARMVMEHRDDVGVVVFTSQAWGPLVLELILEWSQETIKLEAVYSGIGITYRGGDGVPRSDAAVGAPGVAQDAPIVDEGGQADLAPA